MTTGAKFSSIIILTAFAMLLSSACQAEDVEVIHIVKEAEEKIISDYAEQKGWCDQPVPEAKKGEIVISWGRDGNGKCLQQNISVED